ncbi:MAG TPA: PE domain-containing protein [Pseudonocardiaceae bacterium]|nr:PE domain-containing protein [Pseudonocardiaceae bacterium]
MATDKPRAAAGDSVLDSAVLSASTGAGLGAETTVPQAANITVNHDNVLKAAKIIQDALDTEGQQIRSNLPMLQVMAPGEDQISVQAAQAWNNHLVGGADSYTVRVEQYLRSLQNLVSNLITSAKQYGYSDQQIADAFGQTGAGG